MAGALQLEGGADSVFRTKSWKDELGPHRPGLLLKHACGKNADLGRDTMLSDAHIAITLRRVYPGPE